MNEFDFADSVNVKTNNIQTIQIFFQKMCTDWAQFQQRGHNHIATIY